jgi:hypothetical protein
VSNKDDAIIAFSQFALKVLDQLKASDKNYLLFFDWLPEEFRLEFIKLLDSHYPYWLW